MTKLPKEASSEVPGGLVVFGAGEGVPLAQGPLLKGRSEWTAGRVCITDSVVRPRSFTPIHRHADQSQTVIVVRGVLGFYVEGSPVATLGAGAYAFRPPGLFHALWNPTDDEAHAVEITSPGEQFQEYMLELSELTAAGVASRERVAEAAARAGIDFTEDGAEELCATYGLTPAGVFWR